MIKHHKKKITWGGEGLFALQLIIKGHQGRNLGAEIETEAMREHCLAPHGFLSCLLRETRTTCPRVAPPTLLWALSHQSLSRKCHEDSPTDNGRKVFSQLRFLFPADSRVRQVDRTKHRLAKSIRSMLSRVSV